MSHKLEKKNKQLSKDFVSTKFYYVVTEFILSQQNSVCHDLAKNKAKTDFVTTKFYYIATEFILSQQSHKANFVATKFDFVVTKILTKPKTLSRQSFTFLRQRF